MHSYFDISLPEDCSVVCNASVQGSESLVCSHTAVNWQVLGPHKELKVITNITASSPSSPSEPAQVVSSGWYPSSEYQGVQTSYPTLP